MRIDLIRPDAWDKLSDRYRAALQPQISDPGAAVQIYLGYHHALWESTQALAKIFPHKKSIVLVHQGEPAFDSIAVAFSAEGYTVHSLKHEVFARPSEWPGGGLAALQADLLFILFSEDNPVTGQIHHYPEVQAACKAVRVFTISVSHASYKYEKIQPPAPFEIRVLSLRNNRALLLGGTRCKIRPPLVAQLPWFEEDVADVRAQVTQAAEPEVESAQRAIQAFESKLPAGFKAYFAAEPSFGGRVWDRAVIYHTEFDGLSVINELKKHVGGGFSAPGETADFETMSPCRWESPRLSDWLRAQNEADDLVRGLILISAHSVGAPVKKALELAAQELAKIQNG